MMHKHSQQHARKERRDLGFTYQLRRAHEPDTCHYTRIRFIRQRVVSKTWPKRECAAICKRIEGNPRKSTRRPSEDSTSMPPRSPTSPMHQPMYLCKSPGPACVQKEHKPHFKGRPQICLRSGVFLHGQPEQLRMAMAKLSLLKIPHGGC